MARAKSGSAEELKALLDNPRLTRVAAKIRALARPAIRITVTPGKAAGQARPGASRAGGIPDLPVGMELPRYDDEHVLSFLLQVRLEDVAKHDVEGLLPKDGCLSFFIGENIDDADYLTECRVLHFPKGTKLAPTRYPDKTTERYKPASLAFAPALSLPPPEWKLVKKLRMTDDEEEAYNDEVYNVFAYESWKGGYFQMLGHDRNAYHDGPADKDESLLCVSSLERIGWEWGDGNRLAFYVDQRDLRKRKLDDVRSMYVDAC